MSHARTRDHLLALTAQYRPACILTAAAELDLFTALHEQPATAASLARRVGAAERGTTILIDALVSLSLLVKDKDTYRVPAELAPFLTEAGKDCLLPILRHHANCLRRWADLARTVKTGGPPVRTPSIRGADEDTRSFIGAMHAYNGPVAERLVAEVCPHAFSHLLDVGGASGTWTIAFLRRSPSARATIFDLPDVIPMAQKRMADAGLADRVTLAPGNFYTDALPGGADLVWLSAIAHQNSRQQNVALFAKIHAALAPGGTLLLRDVVMDDSHAAPQPGALFAVNMLANTDSGSTYSLSEYRDDMLAAGFTDVALARHDEYMDAVIAARKA